MGSTGDIRLRLGADILRAVIAQGGSREDVERVLDECPELVTPWGIEIVERAKVIRGKAAELVCKLFRTVKSGAHKDAAAVTKSLAASGCQISKWAADIMTKPEFTLSQTESDDELVVVSNAELGFPEGTTFENTCRRALEFGLDLCAAEDGPALRGSYLDQPMGERLIVAMEPITGSGGDLDAFYVERNEGGLWLNTARGDPQRFWSGLSRFVFRRRK